MAETKLFGMTINLGKKKGPEGEEEAGFDEDELKNFTPGVPQVTLLPPSIVEKYRVEAIRSKFIAAILIVILILGLGYAVTLFLESRSKNELENLEQEGVSLNTQLTTLSAYKNYVEEVEEKRQTLFEQFSSAIKYDEIATILQEAASSSDVTISEYTFGSTGGDGICASPDPFNPSSSIGCITITGESDDVDSVIDFTERLEEEEIFINPYFPTVTIAEGNVSLNGSVGYTSKASSVPYPDMSIGVLEQIDPDSSEDNTSEENTEESPPTDEEPVEENDEAGGE